MPKIPECDCCQYFVNSPYLVCGVNPCGPVRDTCDDFKALAQPFPWQIAQSDAEAKRQLLGGGYYAGDWIPQPFPAMSTMKRLALLDWHPQFTGRCPNCEVPMVASLENQWKCEYCDWEDAPRS